MKSHSIKSLVIVLSCLFLAACGGKKNVSMKVLSDPLGAYALMKITYKGEEESDWLFLGPTPINQDKRLSFDGATKVSLKVIRPGFFDQEKSWKAKDFLKEAKRNKQIIWVPNLVQQ